MIKKVLTDIWVATNLPCSKRLKALLPLWLPHYKETLPDLDYLQILSISPASIDRMMKPDRDKFAKRTAFTSDCLQSPDDEEATYRRKNGNHHHGRSINIVETANPENEVNLIIDVDVNPNNVQDGVALNKRYDRLKEKTPDLNEMHTDGAYGSSNNDVKCAELNITQIQTAVCGRQTEV